MEGLVNQVIALSSPGDHAQLITVLRGADGLLAQNQQHILGALQLLDPPAHSLGALYLLWVLGCRGRGCGDGEYRLDPVQISCCREAGAPKEAERHVLPPLHDARRHALCKGGLNPQGDGPFIDYVSRFLQVCNGPQIQHAPDLCESFCRVHWARCGSRVPSLRL